MEGEGKEGSPSMKKRVARYGIIVGFMAMFSLYAAALPSFWDNLPEDQLVEDIVSHMTDEELLGQVFFLGYIGKDPSNYIKKWIVQRNLGGVKIFSRNIDDLTTLSKGIYDIQNLAVTRRLGIPLLVSTDQEGGWVRHISGEVIKVPGNLALGASTVINDSFLTGYYIGIELAILGINMNFAPTVDVYWNPYNTGIGPRSFSSDPLRTGLCALAYYRGMKKAGIICTAKHFPGHGGTRKDSHGYLPEVNASLDDMWERDFIPYRFLIQEQIPAIMSGHIAFPKITGKDIPATSSYFFLTEILRKKLNFRGIVITDDLEMYGARKGGEDIPDVSKKAFLAGSDMVLISHTPSKQEKAWKYLCKLIKTDRLFKARVIEAAKRVVSVKLASFKGGKPSPIFPDYEHAVEKILQIQEAESKEAVFQSACRSVTVIKKKMIPYKPAKNEKVVIISQYEGFINVGLKRFPQSSFYEYSYYPSEWSLKKERETIGNLVKQHDTVIFHLVNYNSFEVLESIKKYKKNILVVSSLTPVYLRKAPWVHTAIAVYGTGEDSYKAGFAVLSGDYKAQGIMPLTFE
jgi:beta-N-acetylhexosaminidase